MAPGPSDAAGIGPQGSAQIRPGGMASTPTHVARSVIRRGTHWGHVSQKETPPLRMHAGGVFSGYTQTAGSVLPALSLGCVTAHGRMTRLLVSDCRGFSRFGLLPRQALRLLRLRFQAEPERTVRWGHASLLICCSKRLSASRFACLRRLANRFGVLRVGLSEDI